jgi:hypothetical protein
MHDQTEKALRQHLSRVTAPAELWERVQTRPVPVAARNLAQNFRWVVATLIVAVGCGWLFLEGRPASGPLELHSASASEVREWVLANSGLDVPLAAKPSSLVEILGASIDRAGSLIAIISYRVGELRATLLVQKSPAGDTPHAGTEMASTWTMGGQLYTLALAGPGELRTACLLCHSSPAAAVY